MTTPILRLKLVAIWVGAAIISLAPVSLASDSWAQGAPVRSETVPDDDEPKNALPSKPQQKPAPPQRRKNGYIQPGPDGIVRTDPIVEPGDPGYVGPAPKPRPRPKPPSPDPLLPEPVPDPQPEPPKPEPAKPEPKPEAPKPEAPKPQPGLPKPPKYVPPKPVLVPEPGDALPQPQPEPSQPEPQPKPPAPQPDEDFMPPEAFPEPVIVTPQPDPRPPEPDPKPEPKPEPPKPDPQPQPSTGLIDSGLSDVTGRAFTYYPPGDLKSGTGTGVRSDTIFAPGMRYPIESAPAFPNSQVYGRGGYLGPGGGLCDAANYAYPWRDNFCEKRGWQTPACPGGKGHQGQDIRAMDCKNAVHWVVAAEDGVITKIGSWSVNLKGTSGREYIYLHMRMRDLAVQQGQLVKRGQRMGKVSNDFGGAPTSIHLHFEIRANAAVPGQPAGFRKVPPYSSLVDAYKRLLRGQP
jgi:murein DD-endopeptidase MepM/ murein hydrolase activator NlpD